jgi:hypothetical protein
VPTLVQYIFEGLPEFVTWLALMVYGSMVFQIYDNLTGLYLFMSKNSGFKWWFTRGENFPLLVDKNVVTP